MSSIPHRVRDQEGIALLIAVILLLMVSAIGLTALQSAQSESTGSGRSRAKVATLFAATAALEVVEQNLDQETSLYPSTAPIDLPNFMVDQFGGSTAVRTGTTDSATPQAIQLVGHTPGEGGQLNVNSANTLSYGIYRANIVATNPGGSMVELQSQYSISEGAQTYK
ncbi:MAG: hypothetical protein GY725_26790 [bacterium]|nr:hypothetical protein [bacterium]